MPTVKLFCKVITSAQKSGKFYKCIYDSVTAAIVAYSFARPKSNEFAVTVVSKTLLININAQY